MAINETWRPEALARKSAARVRGVAARSLARVGSRKEKVEKPAR